MRNLLEMTMTSDETGIITLKDGRELAQSDAFIVDKNSYRKFLEWEKRNASDRLNCINESIDKLTEEGIGLHQDIKRILGELTSI